MHTVRALSAVARVGRWPRMACQLCNAPSCAPWWKPCTAVHSQVLLVLASALPSRKLYEPSRCRENGAERPRRAGLKCCEPRGYGQED